MRMFSCFYFWTMRKIGGDLQSEISFHLFFSLIFTFISVMYLFPGLESNLKQQHQSRCLPRLGIPLLPSFRCLDFLSP